MEPEQKTTAGATETTPEITKTEVTTVETTPILLPATATPSYIQIPVKSFKRYAYAFLLGVLLVLIAYLFSSGVFVAATVNGSPISRLSIIEKLEQQGGQEALQAIVNERLINGAIEKSNVTVEQSAVDAKIAEIKAQVETQGGTLEEALVAESMTMEQLRKQIETQQKLEKILGDKLVVNDEEVATFITDNKITIPKGTNEEELKTQVAEQLKQQKFQAESQKWIADITASANIKYYVTY